MEKKSSDSFHYYHFLRSATEPETQDTPATPPAPQETQTVTNELFNQIAS